MQTDGRLKLYQFALDDSDNIAKEQAGITIRQAGKQYQNMYFRVRSFNGKLMAALPNPQHFDMENLTGQKHDKNDYWYATKILSADDFPVILFTDDSSLAKWNQSGIRQKLVASITQQTLDFMAENIALVDQVNNYIPSNASTG